jgi:hypothetical protein
LLVLALLVAGPARADVVTLVPGRDNTLYEQAAGTLSNGAGPSFFAGRTAQATNSIRRGLVWFDVAAALPAGAVISGATLRLSLTGTSGGSFAAGLHRVSASWGEGASNAGDSGGGGAPALAGDATWRHRVFPGTLWTTAGGDFAAAASASIAVGDLDDYTWGSTAAMVADAQAWLDAPADNHGWLVRGTESSAPSSKKFESRQSSTPALRPLLTLEYTLPTPAVAATWGRVKAGYR